MGLKHTANFQALQQKLLLACMEGIFKSMFIFKHLKINIGDTITDKRVTKKKRILLVTPQSKRSWMCSRQYSSKLNSSTVNVMSFHCRGVARTPEISRAKLPMDRLGNSATFLYFISDPHI